MDDKSVFCSKGGKLNGVRKKKSFICVFCKYKSSHYSNLYVHMRIHTGEKPYFCGECGHRASQGSTLKMHIKSHHPGSDCFNMDSNRRFKLQNFTDNGKNEIVLAPIINEQVISTFESLKVNLDILGKKSNTKIKAHDQTVQSNLDEDSSNHCLEHPQQPLIPQNIGSQLNLFLAACLFHQELFYLQNSEHFGGTNQSRDEVLMLKEGGRAITGRLSSKIDTIVDSELKRSLSSILRELNDLFR